jgi:hypothetical protein
MNRISSVIAILACAWALLRYRPLRIARGLFPWLLLTSTLSLVGAPPALQLGCKLLAFFGVAFCISLVASTYASLVYPAYARPTNLTEELKVAAVALWKTVLVAIAFALSAQFLRAALGVNWWDAKYWISAEVMTLCLTFFVVESHLKQGMSAWRLAGALRSMPSIVVMIIAAALAWTLAVNLLQDQVRPLSEMTAVDETIPEALRAGAVAFYIAAFAYLRIWGAVLLFVALYAFWHYQGPSLSGFDPRLPKRPLPLVVRRK